MRTYIGTIVEPACYQFPVPSDSKDTATIFNIKYPELKKHHTFTINMKNARNFLSPDNRWLTESLAL